MADTEVTAITQVVSAMAQGLKARDGNALVALWAPARRDAVRDRIRTALARPGAIDLRLSLVGVRLEPGRRTARVAWDGTWGGQAVSGGFDMELTPDDPPRIVAVRGEDPTGAGTPAGAPDTGDLPTMAP